VGVISTFNFPVAVWAWNAALACRTLLERALARFGAVPEALARGLMQIVIDGAEVGRALVADRRMGLISATGSCAMGHEVGAVVLSRLGRVLLELGGNNAMVVAPSADFDLASRAILFAAIGTAGQHCTTLRRLIVHEDVHGALLGRLGAAYATIPIGSPLEDGILVGPLSSTRNHVKR